MTTKQATSTFRRGLEFPLDPNLYYPPLEPPPPGAKWGPALKFHDRLRQPSSCPVVSSVQVMDAPRMETGTWMLRTRKFSYSLNSNKLTSGVER